MKLRLAKKEDIENIMIVINDAKKYLKEQGSLQWNLSDGYPRECDLLKDIENGYCYVLENENKIIGTMSIIVGIDENYNNIYEGKWLTNNPYASIHRIAIKNTHHHLGLGKKMLQLAENIVISKNVYSIRIDTHKINIPMRKTIINAGYAYCGIIKLLRSETDNLRDAYEKVLTEI